MSTDRHSPRRSQIAWLLYAFMVFTTLHCGLGHGQASGLALAGFGGAFCSHSGQPAPADSPDTQSAGVDDSSFFSCPVCSSPAVAPLLVLLAFWLCCRKRIYRPCTRHPRAWPRLHWPTANPRASPIS